MLTPRGIKNGFMRFATELRFPKLLALTVALFAVDFMIPDFIPFADEILLGLLAAILAALKKSRRGPPEQHTEKLADG
jgi:Family of unknown function (DUF6116)